MNGHSATILPFPRPSHAAWDTKSSSSIVDDTSSAAVRLETGATGLLNQVEENKAIIARVQEAASTLTGRAEALRATADKFLAAIREEIERRP
jgi:hypothetical protein